MRVRAYSLENVNHNGQFLKFLFRSIYHAALDIQVFCIPLTVTDKQNECTFLRDSYVKYIILFFLIDAVLGVIV